MSLAFIIRFIRNRNILPLLCTNIFEGAYHLPCAKLEIWNQDSGGSYSILTIASTVDDRRHSSNYFRMGVERTQT